VERKPSRIEIYNADIQSWNNPFLEIDLHVSKGTYIRSYAHDLGRELKVGAILKELTRTAVEPYTLEESFTIESFQHYWSSLKVNTNGSAQRNR
jgi:tRNA pseudouridine55 synthase